MAPAQPPTRRVLEDDAVFDALYPDEVRRVSRRFWTPVAIAGRAATLLHEHGARSVLDVGSGAGKFGLVAAGTFDDLSVLGVEQRADLVAVAEAARAALGLPNVRFVHGDATELPWDDFDGLYFYNSFAENLFDPDDRIDNLPELGMARFGRDVQRTAKRLAAAKVGAAVATFYGSSGRIPCTFELAHQEAAASGFLRLWVKKRMEGDGSFYVEDGCQVVQYEAPEPPRG